MAPDTRGEIKAYQQILDFLIRTHGVTPHAHGTDSTVRQLGHGIPDPAAALQALAFDAGLVTEVVTRSLADVLADAEPSYPWLAIKRGADGRPEAIAVLRKSVGGAVVTTPGSAAAPSRWSTASLCRWLDVPDAASPTAWLLAEPAAPLSLLRSPGEEPLTPLRRLRALLVGERRTLWVAVVYSILIGLLTLVLPVAVQSMVNTLAFGNALQPLVVLTFFVFVALALSMGMNTARAKVVEIIQRSIFARVATDVTWRLLHVRASAFDKHHGPELVNRFFDTVTLQKSASLLLIDGLSIVMQTGVSMLLLAIYHPWLLAYDVLLIGAMAIIVFLLGRGAIRTSIGESKAKYALEAWLEQLAAKLVTFKSDGGHGYAVQRSHALLEEYLHYRDEHFRILLRQIIGSFALQALASASLLGIGGWLVIERQLTLGQLVAAEIIVAGMMSAFTKFGKQLEVFYDLCAAIDKLGGLVDLPLERAGGHAEPAPTGPLSVEVRGLAYTMPEEREPVVSVEGWSVAAGDRVGITGPSGSGKSTLADILFGLRTPGSGALLLGGTDSRAIPLRVLRQRVALVRSVELFAGTVLENVTLGREHVTYDAVTGALARVGLLDDLLALPGGLNTELHPQGRPLSHRQACRLMVARAIVDNPGLLILDGVLDQLDIEEQARLAADIFSPSAPWTLICISERPDVLAQCTRVVTMRDGRVRATGEVGR
ncbi:MAG: peptidase domain-containing ABC transporter [Vicinamibacterales bacterium]